MKSYCFCFRDISQETVAVQIIQRLVLNTVLFNFMFRVLSNTMDEKLYVHVYCYETDTSFEIKYF